MSTALWALLVASIGIFAVAAKRYGEDTVYAVGFVLSLIGVFLAFLGLGTVEF